MDSDAFGIPFEDFERIQNLFQEGGVKNLSAILSEKADEWKESVINIAVCGETYVGKSTFINTSRSVSEKDEGYAPVGIGDTTTEPIPYKHPKNKNMVLWDLPGVGTLRFPKDETYFDTIQIKRYDFFLIFSDQCFSENDAWLGKEVKRLGKSFFFVRSKLDEAMSNASKDGQRIEEVVPRLYHSCYENLENAGIKDSQIFIISNYNHEIGQFDDLMTAILETLSNLKKEAILHSIGPLTHQIIREKKKMLQNRALLKGFLPAFSLVPVIGSYFNETELIEEELDYCMAQFGLDDVSLDRLCGDLKTTKDQITLSLNRYERLKERGNGLENTLLEFYLSQKAEEWAGKYKRYIPLLKMTFSSMIAYCTSVYCLRQQISCMEEDAHTLIDFVIGRHNS